MMKKSRLMAAFFLCFAGALHSCTEIETLQEDNAEISVTNGFQVVAYSSTSAAFEVKSNADWRVVCDAGWISDYTREGSGDGTVTLSFSENSDSENERSASIAIIAGTKSRSVTLVQTRHGYEVTDAELTLSVIEGDPETPQGGEDAAARIAAETVSYSLNVESNTIWGVYTEADWLNSYTKMGEGDGKIELEFDSYKNRREDRYATFYVSARDVTKVFKLIQTKTDQILIEDITVEKFSGKAPDPEMFYRLLGIVESIEGTGALTIADYSGSLKISGVAESKENSATADFTALGVEEGDVVAIVGVRDDNYGAVVLGEPYLDVHHPVEVMSLSEFAKESDNTDNWYRIEGIISDITDNVNGGFTISEKGSDVTFTVDGVLSGVNGQRGQFANFGAKEEDIIILLAPGKTGNVITDAAYLGHKPSKMPIGVLADWTFDKNHLNEFLTTWVPAGTGEDVKYVLPADMIGETPYFLWDDAKKSKMIFYQAERPGISTTVQLVVFNSGQPGFQEMWLNDAFVFDIDAGVAEIPAGTKLKFQCVPRLPSAFIGCFMFEWYDGKNWEVAIDPANPVKTLEIGGTTYEFNIQRKGNNDETLLVFNFEITKPVPELKLRMRAAAPYSCDGKNMTKPSGTGRFRSGVSKSNPEVTECSPYLEVVE